MKRLIYILLAGLAAAGLASCEKQELKPSVSDIYAVEIEEDALQTKASSNDIEKGGEKTFFATLKKSSDGGKTYSYVSHSKWKWTPPTNCSIKSGSQNNNDTKHGVTAGSVVIVGNSVNTANLTVTATSTPTGGDISKNVAVTVTPTKRTVTFNFTPNTTEMLSVMQNKFGTTSGCTGKASVSCPIEVTDGSGNDLGSASFAAFYQYTAPSKLESIKSFSSATRDERVLSLQVKIEEGKTLKFKLKAGNIAFPDNDNRTNQKVSVSQGSKISTPTGYYAAYQISSVNSDLTINVTTPN